MDLQPRIGVGVLFYEDENSIGRTLDSVSDYVDKIFCIDGCFPEFTWKTSDDGLSHDGSRDIVKQYKNTVLVDMPFEHEPIQRNKYLDLCKEYDCNFLIILDTDEYATGSWEAFNSELDRIAKFNEEHKDELICNVFHMYIYDSRPNFHNWHMRPRLWYNPWEMEYFHNHHTFRRKKEYVSNEDKEAQLSSLFWSFINYNNSTIDGVRIYHEDSIRLEEYNKARYEHRKWVINGGEERHHCPLAKVLGDKHTCTPECRYHNRWMNEEVIA